MVQNRTVGSRLLNAFTLIELLVVIVIIALLISILLPALREARLTARMLRESATCRSQLQVWHNYASTYKDGLMIPGIPWPWAHPVPGGGPSNFYGSPPDMINGDSGSMTMGIPTENPDTTIASDQTVAGPAPAPAAAPGSNVFIEGSCIKVWPLRFWGWAEFPGYEMQTDKLTYQNFRARTWAPSNTQTLYGEVINTYDAPNSFGSAMAYHPTFGINAVFVGGHYGMGAYAGATATVMGRAPNKYFVKRLSEITRPDMLLVFCDARSVDLNMSSMGATNYGQNGVPYASTASPIVPGFHMVTPPKMGQISSPLSMPTWSTSDKFTEISNPANWGFVYPKWKGRAVTGFSDGHVVTKTIKELRDMRFWSDKAKDKDWIPTLN